MSELQDVIIRDSDKRFRLRIDGFLRSIGVSQIIGTKEFLDFEFVGGEGGIRVIYPREMKDLYESIKKELLAEKHLSHGQIDNIRFYVNDYMEEIEKVINEKS